MNETAPCIPMIPLQFLRASYLAGTRYKAGEIASVRLDFVPNLLGYKAARLAIRSVDVGNYRSELERTARRSGPALARAAKLVLSEIINSK